MRFRHLGDFLRCHLRREALQHRSVATDQEFREVPDDVFLALRVGEPRLEELVDLAGAVTVDVDLRKHREGRPVFRSRELENFSIGSRFLRSKLVARKSENTESIIVVM